VFKKQHHFLKANSPTQIILSFAFLGFVFQILLGLYDTRYWPLSGDEWFYFECAKDINRLFSAIIAGDHAQTKVYIDAIVADGWFMPGMPLLLQPTVLLDMDLPQTRLYMILVNFTLTLVIALRLQKLLPAAVAQLWLVIMLLFPAVTFFSPTLWGESMGGKLYLLLLIELYLALERSGTKWNPLLPVVTGFSLGFIIYIRPNFIILSPLLVCGVFYHQLRLQRFAQACVHAVRFGLIAALTTCIILLPWQLALHQKFGAFFLTTTSLDLNTIIAYTDKSYESQLPGETTQSAFTRTHTLISTDIEARAKRSGETYGATLREQRNETLGNLTLARYMDVTRHSLLDFFCKENMFLYRFEKFPGSLAIKSFLYPVLLKLNTLLWYILLASTLVLFFRSLRAPIAQWLSTALKLSLALLWVQPFMMLSNGRYYVAFIPLMALLVSLYAGYYYEQRQSSG